MAETSLRPDLVEILLFDLGGVVIDIDFRRCFTSWAGTGGSEAADIGSRFGFDTAYEDHERGQLAIGDYLASLRRSLQIDLSDEQLLTGWNDIYIGPISEVVDLLGDAKEHFPLYAFTNTNPAHQAVWSERFATELDVFDTIYSSSEIGHRKPDRAAFDLVASLMGAPPTAILFFDDSPENVAGAVAAGMQAVHVTSPDAVRAALHTLIAAASTP